MNDNDCSSHAMVQCTHLFICKESCPARSLQTVDALRRAAAPTGHASPAGLGQRVIWASCPALNQASGLLGKDQGLSLGRTAPQGQTLPAHLRHKGRRMHVRVLEPLRPAVCCAYSLHTGAGLTVSPRAPDSLTIKLTSPHHPQPCTAAPPPAVDRRAGRSARAASLPWGAADSSVRARSRPPWSSMERARARHWPPRSRSLPGPIAPPSCPARH